MFLPAQLFNLSSVIAPMFAPGRTEEDATSAVVLILPNRGNLSRASRSSTLRSTWALKPLATWWTNSSTIFFVRDQFQFSRRRTAMTTHKFGPLIEWFNPLQARRGIQHAAVP
jgi:hypothetical protein